MSMSLLVYSLSSKHPRERKAAPSTFKFSMKQTFKPVKYDTGGVVLSAAEQCREEKCEADFTPSIERYMYWVAQSI